MERDVLLLLELVDGGTPLLASAVLDGLALYFEADAD